MKRREFIAFLCGAMASAKSVRAEGKRKRPLIAYLATASQSAATIMFSHFWKGCENRLHRRSGFRYGVSICGQS